MDNLSEDLSTLKLDRSFLVADTWDLNRTDLEFALGSNLPARKIVSIVVTDVKRGENVRKVEFRRQNRAGSRLVDLES